MLHLKDGTQLVKKAISVPVQRLAILKICRFPPRVLTFLFSAQISLFLRTRNCDFTTLLITLLLSLIPPAGDAGLLKARDAGLLNIEPKSLRSH